MGGMKTSTLPPLTIADLESMPDDGNRYELIDGEIFVSSAPSFFHQSVLMNIAAAFLDYQHANPIGKILPGVGVIFDDYNGVIPDLVFLTHERRRKIVGAGKLRAAPEIAIEILSPGVSNERRDRHIKRDLYSARGVSEYWIVDSEDRAVETYRRGDGGLEFFGSLKAADAVTSDILPGFRVAAEAFFAD
jgi:Uma2 family endonuclease